MSVPRKKVLLKIIILGDSGVGKTAILHKFVSGQFIEQHKATIGADFSTKEITVDDKLVTLQMWDTAGQERFASLGHAFYRGADACILVYDICNDQSFKSIEQWRSNFLDNASPENAQDFPFLLIGNKSDLNDKRQVSTTDGQRISSQHKMEFNETSAYNGNNIDKAIRDIARIASNRDTAPFFTDEINKLKLDEVIDHKPQQQSPCACNLI